MKRRFAWFFGLTLGIPAAAGFGWAQETDLKPRSETPRSEVPTTQPTPVAVVNAPVSEVFATVESPRANFLFGVEYLNWWYKRDAIPSLLNTATETDTQFAGTANDPNAVSLFGPSQYAYKTIPGVRANASFALTETINAEFSGFLMQSASISNSFSGTNGTPFLTRPFFNQHDLVESGYDTSSMSGLSGNINFQANNRFYGGGAAVSWFPCIDDNPIYKLSFGVRQISLTESLAITENVSEQSVAGAAPQQLLAFFPLRVQTDPQDTIGQLVTTNFNPATQSIRIVDGFNTRNEFIGPKFGAQWRSIRGAFSFDLLTKVAVGVNHQSIQTQGSTSLLTNGVVTQTGPGGLLAVTPNSGRVTHDELTVVPELGLKFNFDITQHFRVSCGYNLLYMSSVARPGDQIDRRINPQYVPSDIAYFPGTSGPGFPRGFFRDTDFYAHGITIGLEVTY